MAASYSFFPSVGTVVQSSLRLIRGLDPEETISTTAQTNAIEAMNYILTSWQTFGLQVWLRTETAPITMTADQTLYTVGSGGDINIDRPTEIYQAWLEDSLGARQVLNQLSENEHNLLSNTSTSSIPNSYYYNAAYQVDSNQGSTSKGQLHLWPAADSSTVAAKTLHFLYTRPLETSTTSTDLIDMPQEWMAALKWELASQLAPEYGVPASEQDRLMRKAMMLLEEAKGWDAEKTSISIHPDSKVLR